MNIHLALTLLALGVLIGLLVADLSNVWMLQI